MDCRSDLILKSLQFSPVLPMLWTCRLAVYRRYYVNRACSPDDAPKLTLSTMSFVCGSMEVEKTRSQKSEVRSQKSSKFIPKTEPVELELSCTPKKEGSEPHGWLPSA
jgi:hypothetical protein